MQRELLKMQIAILAVCLAFAGFGYAQTYTFTNATATGQNGPTQGQTDAEYTGSTLDGTVTVNAGIQTWTVPTTGSYTIEAFGAQGYGPFGGRGAHISGEFNLTAGTTLKILVGQTAPPPVGSLNQYAGGGGSFVTTTTNTPYIVAGGGGGNHGGAYVITADASITNDGYAGAASNSGAGGTAGAGGLGASSADAGGGLLGNGGGVGGGLSFVNGGVGGAGTTSGHGEGGFGCGGGTSSWDNFRAGGGGGYSGGGGGGENGQVNAPAGGGGGSFNSGTNPVDLAGVQTGDGLVIITLNCNPTVGTLIADNTSLPDLSGACVISSWTEPTATNDCNAIYAGTPDVSLPINTVGTTVVTWTYDDGVNVITQTQNVIITGIDNDPPVLDNPNLLTFSNPCSFTPAAPTATDVCQGVIQGVPDLTLPITTQGTNVITWTFDDGFGNVVTQQQTININDASAPSADQATLDTYQECNEATPSTPTATDNCAGTLDGTPDVTFPITAGGTTTVTWTYDDGNGNITTQTQDVFVEVIDLTVDASNAPQLSANATGVTYQWINCTTGDTIVGATGQGYQPSVTGEYAAIMTSANCEVTSECVLVDFTGIDELDSDKINIFPNPTNSGLFTVDFDGAIDEIVVIDALGRTIELPVDYTAGAVNGSSLASGRYTVRVFASEAVYTKALIIIE